jgi:hypothetical protein
MNAKLIAAMTLAAMALAGCTRTITKEVPIEVRVPVAVPCMLARPEVEPSLKEQIERDQWDDLTTDQRANLVAAQALARKLYGDRLTDAAAGCR